MIAATTRVVVVGGGIAGLAAAYELGQRLPAAEILLLEGARQVGGKLRISELAGHPVDVGAEAMLVRRPDGIALARAVGLGDELISPLTTTAQLMAGGTRHPLPTGTMMGIPGDLPAVRATGILSDDALRQVEAEPLASKLAPLAEDISVASLVRQRLGDEVLDRLVEPFLGGVYAGRAEHLSVAATMGGLWAHLHRAGGSLVEAAQALAPPPREPGAASQPVFTSIGGGLGRLASTVAERGRFHVRTGVTVRSIQRTATGFQLECGPVPATELIDTSAVVVALPPPKAAIVLERLSRPASRELAAIETASMAIVSLAFDRVSPPPGSGLLIGTREGFATKAITLSSQKWPGAPAGLTLLRASIGRAGETEHLQRDDTELTGLVAGELGPLLGIQARPVDALVTRWGGGLPQYDVGHLDRVTRIRAAVAAVPGLAVCGATYDGIGIPACISSARRAAQSVLEAIEARTAASGGSPA